MSAEVDTASAANVAVFIWCDNSDATVGDFIDLTEVQLELGHFPSRFERPHPMIELLRCKRYFERLAHAGSTVLVAPAFNRLTTDAFATMKFDVRKRAAPTMARSNGAHVDVMHANTTATSTEVAFALTTPEATGIIVTTSGLTAGQGSTLRLNTSAAYIQADAEL